MHDATRRDARRLRGAGKEGTDRLISANGDCVNNFRRRRIVRDYMYVRTMLTRDALFSYIRLLAVLSERANERAFTLAIPLSISKIRIEI